MGCLEIVLALCGDCKLRKPFTIFHLHPSIPSVCDFFFLPSIHDGKRGAEPYYLAADCTVCIYANPRLSASKLTAVWFMSLSSAIMWLSSLCGGWMCGSLCLVIRTVNDRDAWRDRERAGGEWGLVVRVGVEGVSWRFEPYQGFTAGHNSMCGDCVEGLASRARASPRGLLCVGAVAFAFRAFPLLFVAC